MQGEQWRKKRKVRCIILLVGLVGHHNYIRTPNNSSGWNRDGPGSAETLGAIIYYWTVVVAPRGSSGPRGKVQGEHLGVVAPGVGAGVAGVGAGAGEAALSCTVPLAKPCSFEQGTLTSGASQSAWRLWVRHLGFFFFLTIFKKPFGLVPPGCRHDPIFALFFMIGAKRKQTVFPWIFHWIYTFLTFLAPKGTGGFGIWSRP